MSIGFAAYILTMLAASASARGCKAGKQSASKTTRYVCCSFMFHGHEASIVLPLCCRQHGMPAEHFQDNASYKVRRSQEGSKKLQGIPARHPNSAPPEEDEGDSLDAFVVETRLVPVSLSQIPDRLPDNVSLGHKRCTQTPQFLCTPLQACVARQEHRHYARIQCAVLDASTSWDAS